MGMCVSTCVQEIVELLASNFLSKVLVLNNISVDKIFL